MTGYFDAIEPPPAITFPVECVRSDVGSLWFPVADTVMLPYLRNRGYWEAEEAALFKRLLRPGIRFLDVGANVGYFSMFVAQNAPGAQIDACEPHPTMLQLLRMNLWTAQVRARIWPLALGAGDRCAALSTVTTNYGDTRAALGDLAGIRSDLITAAASVDQIFSDRSFDLVKIDVQGAESAVLAGMRAVVQRSPRIKIIAEFWPTALRERGLDPEQVLIGYGRDGYEVRTLVQGKLRKLDPTEIVQVCDSGGEHGQVNLLLMPM